MQCQDIQVDALFGAAEGIVDKEINMNNWKYVIAVSTENIFEEIEKAYTVNFSNELKKFILAHNAASPEKYHFVVNGIERVFGAVLSVNKGEEDVDTIYTAFRIMNKKEMIPFAIDPFGNYICCLNNEVLFWEHETENIISTGLDFSSFIESLY